MELNKTPFSVEEKPRLLLLLLLLPSEEPLPYIYDILAGTRKSTPSFSTNGSTKSEHINGWFTVFSCYISMAGTRPSFNYIYNSPISFTYPTIDLSNFDHL